MVVLHRYLGMAVGLLMVIWFVSGIVMMYVGFPRVTEEDRARTLEPLSWQACCRFPQRLAPDDAQVFGTQVENVAGIPDGGHHNRVSGQAGRRNRKHICVEAIAVHYLDVLSPDIAG